MGSNGLVSFLMAASLGTSATLVQNGSFEAGLEGWRGDHAWYEQPQGSGLSSVVAAPGEGREGATALRLDGKANRGLAMQVFSVYPGRYRVTGWIRAQDLGGAEAVILCEWMDRQNRWLRGDRAGAVMGTAAWTHVDTEVVAPPGTRAVHLDLMTTSANSGQAWFDDLAMVRVAGNGPPPAAPALAWMSADEAGSVKATWAPAGLGEAPVRILIRCHPLGTPLPELPWQAVDADEGQVSLSGLPPDTPVLVSTLLVDADGRASPWSAETTVSTGSSSAPRPGFARAESADGRRVQVAWWPHPLEPAATAIRITVASADASRPARTDLPVPAAIAGPFYRTAPRVTGTVTVPPGTAELRLQAVDAAGRAGEAIPVTIQPALRASGPAPCELRFAPATANLPPQGPLPTWTMAPELVLMRGQAKGMQLVCRPNAALHRVRLEPGDLRAEEGDGTIPAHWVAWHAVRATPIEKNSRATPAAALVWPGPAPYPDELDDAPETDLPADATSSVYVRITAPRDARPGWYRGDLRLLCAEGSTTVPLRLRVAAPVLPDTPRLDFVYWFSWEDACRPFGVTTTSPAGWRVLAEVAELMRAHRQNTVVVPWSLARFWRRPDGTLTADYRDFDRFVETFAAHGVDRWFCLSHVGSRTTGEWLCPTMAAHRAEVIQAQTGASERVDVVDLLPLLEGHLRKRGWLERFLIHVADEPIPQNLESYRHLAGRVRAAAPGLRRIDAIHVPDLRGSLEVWVPQLNFLKQWHPDFLKAQAEGATLWFYVAWVPQGAYPNRMIDCPAIKPRLLHWMHARYNTTGYLHWALNRWSIPLTSLESPGDQYICWPSERFIADSSLRYEAEREGLEDAELMLSVREAAERRGLSRESAADHVRDLIRPAVRDAEDLTLDWDVLEQVRLRLLADLESP